VPLGIGPLELVIVLLILIVIFGPKRLPGLGRSLGSGMREFKESITGSGKSDDDDERRELPASAREDEPDREPARTEPARREPEAVAVEAEPAASEKGAPGHTT
jgi:sec-independent protein translocase protein TatA